MSIPSNLTEGSARRTTPEFIAFLHICRGSQAEIDTQLRLVRDIGYLPDGETAVLPAHNDEIGRLLTALITSLRRRDPR